jgi:hypothetical protein
MTTLNDRDTDLLYPESVIEEAARQEALDDELAAETGELSHLLGLVTHRTEDKEIHRLVGEIESRIGSLWINAEKRALDRLVIGVRCGPSGSPAVTKWVTTRRTRFDPALSDAATERAVAESQGFSPELEAVKAAALDIYAAEKDGDEAKAQEIFDRVFPSGEAAS